jgi:hypothetical protein
MPMKKGARKMGQHQALNVHIRFVCYQLHDKGVDERLLALFKPEMG